MSRAPLVMAKPELRRGDQTVWDTTLGWRFPNPRMEEMFPLESMGETGENVAERWAISREEQDAFALESQRRWAAADEAGRFADELVSVGDVDRDEHPAAGHERREARGPQARVPRRRHPHRRKLERDQRRGRRARRRQRGEGARSSALEPLGRVRRQRGRRRRSTGHGHRPGARGAQAARAGRDRRGRPRSRRAERGVRLSEPPGHPRAGARPRARERERRRDRDRPSARDERRAARRQRSCTSYAGGMGATGWRRSASASARVRRPSSKRDGATDGGCDQGVRPLHRRRDRRAERRSAS